MIKFRIVYAMYYVVTGVKYCKGDQGVEFSLNKDEPTEELKKRVACLHGADYYSTGIRTLNTVDFAYFDVSFTIDEECDDSKAFTMNKL